MNHLRSRRPLTLETSNTARINYVLRRYGGLEVYVPRYAPPGGLAGIHNHHHLHHYPNNCDLGGPVLPVLNAGVGVAAVPPVLGVNVNGALIEGDSSSTDSSAFRTWAGVINPFGKFTPLFGGRIVLGPGKAMFVFCLFFLSAVLGLIIFEYVSLKRYYF